MNSPVSAFATGDYLVWVGKNSSFKHYGRVISKDHQSIKFNTPEGVIHVGHNDGSFAPISKIEVLRALNDRANNPVTEEGEPTDKKVTKVDQIIELLGDALLTMPRKDAIAKIVEAGISTEKGASTFHNTAKKLVGNK